MIQRSGIASGERVLITGASGGVGSAAIQLVKWRRAEVIVVAASSKEKQMLEIGAERVIGRDQDFLGNLEVKSVEVVIDLVVGPSFPKLLKLLKRGGRYVSAGAIGSPLVSFDTRIFYLKDLQLIGCTAWDEPVFPTLVFLYRAKPNLSPARQNLPPRRHRKSPERIPA